MKYIVFWWLLALWIEWSFGQVSPTNHWFISGTENSTITTITGDWKQANNSFTSNRPPFLQLRSTLKGQILTNFRAYMFYLYISRPVGSSVSVWLDGKRSTFPFKPQNQSSQRVVLSNGIEDMFVMEGEIGSADHQLLIDASSNSEEHPVIFDRIEMETPDNTPSPLPMNYTTVATSVPAGETVDDVSDSLNYSESGWERKEHPFFYGNSSSVTTTPGSWVQLTFVGTGIWVYGAIPVEGVVFSVEAIRKYGRETTREITTHNFTLPDLEVPIYQAPLLAHSELTYANAYIYNITLISGSMQLDFIRIAGNLAPFGSDDVQAIDQATPSQNGPELKTIVIPSVVGGTFVLLAVGLATFLCKRHRKGRPPTFESDVSMVQDGEGGFVEPFYSVSIQPPIATSGSRTGKAGLHSIFFDQPGPLSPPTGYSHSSVGIESMALDDGNSNNLDYSRRDLSQMGQENEYEVEDGGLSLSHAELAKVFRRAEQLRLHSLPEGDGSGDSEELDPPLEALARQLAIRGGSTE